MFEQISKAWRSPAGNLLDNQMGRLHTHTFASLCICSGTHCRPRRNGFRSEPATRRFFHCLGFDLNFSGFVCLIVCDTNTKNCHQSGVRAITNPFSIWSGFSRSEAQTQTQIHLFRRAHTNLRRLMCLCAAAIIVYALGSNHSRCTTNRY